MIWSDKFLVYCFFYIVNYSLHGIVAQNDANYILAQITCFYYIFTYSVQSSTSKIIIYDNQSLLKPHNYRRETVSQL